MLAQTANALSPRQKDNEMMIDTSPFADYRVTVIIGDGA